MIYIHDPLSVTILKQCSDIQLNEFEDYKWFHCLTLATHYRKEYFEKTPNLFTDYWNCWHAQALPHPKGEKVKWGQEGICQNHSVISLLVAQGTCSEIVRKTKLADGASQQLSSWGSRGITKECLTSLMEGVALVFAKNNMYHDTEAYMPISSFRGPSAAVHLYRNMKPIERPLLAWSLKLCFPHYSSYLF